VSWSPVKSRMRLIGLPIPDIQRENPRCVGRGLLLTRSGSTSFPEPVIEIGKADGLRDQQLRDNSLLLMNTLASGFAPSVRALSRLAFSFPEVLYVSRDSAA